MQDCVFCKIVENMIPSNKVYEDDTVVAFRDINPMAPVHIIVIPKEHITGANDICPANSGVVAHIFEVIPKIAAAEGVAESGYRIISNCGKDAGQTVSHLHFHILGGTQLPLSLA